MPKKNPASGPAEVPVRSGKAPGEPMLETGYVQVAGTEFHVKGVCKDYHFPRRPTDPVWYQGVDGVKKSVCPGWAGNTAVMEALLANALIEPAKLNAEGKPKILYNAVDGVIFIADSTGQADPIYNCYPVALPSGTFIRELKNRKAASLPQVQGSRAGKAKRK